jgi:hypothetical protein
MNPEFIIGLDLGQSQDYTAVAIVERITHRPREMPDWSMYLRWEPISPTLLHVRHLERFRLGTSYPAIVSRVRELQTSPELYGPALVVDATGVGAPVVDLLRVARLTPIPVTITGGDTETQHAGAYRVPKKNLVGVLQTTLQANRLMFAEGLPDVPTLVNELLAFQMKITTAGNDTYGAWREGTHDDLVLAVGLAVWWAEHERVTIGVSPLSNYRG